MTTAICLSVFLDIDDMDLLDKYREIATVHWHGLFHFFIFFHYVKQDNTEEITLTQCHLQSSLSMIKE